MKKENLIMVGIICCTILLSAIIISKANFSWSADKLHTISVSWNGEVRATPDTLILSLRIEDTAKTTAEAQKNVDEKVKEIKELIQSYNIANSNIKTTNMNVYEAYDWTDIWRKSLWFTANHTLEIKIKSANLENEGVWWKIVSQVSEIPWVFLNSINYDIDDKTDLYSQARELAIKKAYQKASDLAKYAGVKLWKPISISEERNYDYAFTTSMAKNSFAEEALDTVEWESDISLGEMNVSLDVNIVYKLK